MDDASAPQSDSATNAADERATPPANPDVAAAPTTGRDDTTDSSNGERITVVVTVRHPLGLHLRIGKEVVLLASRFDAQLTAHNLTRHSPDVDARSILQLMQLQAREGHQLQLSAQGSDAAEAIEALRALLEQPPLHA